MRKFFLFLSFFSLIALTSATTISNENVTVDLSNNNVVVELQVEDLTSSRLTYFTDHHMKRASATIDGEKLKCQKFSSKEGSQISCATSERNNFTAIINYSSEELKYSRKGKETFKVKKSFIRPTKNFKLKILLPRGNIIVKNESDSSLVPRDGVVNTDGQRISVKWKNKPELGDSTTFKAEYRGIKRKDESYLEYVGLVALVIIILTAAFFSVRKLRSKDLESVFKELNDDEIEILEKIVENNGSIIQKDLVDEMGYSKAKISGVVSELVDKEIINKEKEGRSNRLSLKKKFSY